MKIIADSATLVSVVSQLAESTANAPFAPDSEVLREAGRATVRAFRNRLPVQRSRVAAYFRTCVRRGSIRHGDEAGGWLILNAVASDLAQGGRTPEEIWDELSKGWSHLLPPAVLHEYRERLGVAA